jgi:SSS family solute:Na+ symporter
MGSWTMVIILISCIATLVAVAYVSYRLTRTTVSDRDGYFLAGRGLGAPFIAGSLLLTNLSAEQLIGLNGSAYGYNLSAMAWEVTAAIATIAMAFFFLPRYLKGGFTTLPEFLAQRYDEDARRLSVILFLLGYGLVTIPSVLYSGSVAVLKILNIPELLSLGYIASLWVTVIVIGLTGALYAILGGLRAVAVSDTFNGVGLLIVGVMVPFLGLKLLGQGDFGQGVSRLVQEHPEKLNAIGSAADPVPFGTLFTGMIFANLFYWCSNQYVIQRTLAARSLADGQKGVLLSGFFKVLVPFFMMIPGVIAYHLYGPGLSSIDLAYPQLVKDVFPMWLMGFFLAVLLGAVFSSFNSLINSAATLFTLDVIQPMRRRPLGDASLIRVAKWLSVLIAITSVAVAPLLQFAPEGLWQIIRIFTGFYNIPMIVIVLVGMTTVRVPGVAVKTVIGFHVVTYGVFQFLLKDFIDIHFLHLYAILFVLEVGIMLTYGVLRPAAPRRVLQQTVSIDMHPWRHGVACSVTLFSSVIALYVLFSPLGLVGGMGPIFWFVLSVLALINAAVWYVSRRSQLRGGLGV